MNFQADTNATAFALATILALSGCQSTDGEVKAGASVTTPRTAAATEAQPTDTTSDATEQKTVETPPQTVAGAASCQKSIAGGPPPKPARAADFGAAVGKNLGKGIATNVASNIGSRIAGPLGGVVAGAAARSALPPEQDIRGTWTITDGSPTCGCTIEISSIWKLEGKGKDAGSAKASGCNSPSLQAAAKWALGYSFTGYDAKLQLKATNNRSVMATLNREGIHYFQGTLSDGTPVTMWRTAQNGRIF